jgi:hypothetical protein
MEENFIPDYSKYNKEFLIDVYTRIDRDNNPLKAKALDDEIKKRFNLDPNTEINPKVVLGFLGAYQQTSKVIRTESDKYKSMISQGWIAGVVLASISFLTWLIAMLRNDSNVQGYEITVYGILDIIVVYGLSFGIYKNSRACSIVLTSYFILLKLTQLFIVPFPKNIFPLFGLFIFGTFFIRAIIGTVNYYKINYNPESIVDDSVIICPECGEKNHIANYNCKCGKILKPV